MKIIFAVVVLTLFLVTGANAQSYLCVTEQASGFKYDEELNKWKPANFDIKDKYIISKPKSGVGAPNSKWVVTNPETKTLIASCDADIDASNYLFCTGSTGQFNFNSGNLRYLLTYSFGYFNSGRPNFPDSNSNTPYMEIGTCSNN